MDNFPSSYEQFLKLDTMVSKNVSEAQFYKEGYLSIIVLMESSMQVSSIVSVVTQIKLVSLILRIFKEYNMKK